MRVLILGDGYVGGALARCLSTCYTVTLLKKNQLDYTDRSTLFMYLNKQDEKFAFVINTCGYTGRPNVDACEDNIEGMLPQPIEINPNYRPNLPYRPNPNLPFNGNPNMYQRPMRRPFGFGGRPMNSFMGMGLGMMNPMGMGMFGGFPMRPPMFGGYGGGYGGGYNMMRPPMGFGLGGANPYGMNPYSNFGRPNPYPQPSVFSEYNMPRPYNSGMNFNQPHVMQQQQGGYGSYQQPSGYGNYGGMQNPYQPQQMGNTNNFAGYGQQQAMF